MALAEAARHPGDPEAVRLAAAFRSRSPGHSAALKRAELLLDSLPYVESDEATNEANLQLRLEIMWARLLERPALVATAAVATLSVGLALFLTEPAPQAAPPAAMLETTKMPAAIDYRAPPGRTREVALEDGTVVWLDWSSAMTVALSPTLRSIELSAGQAAFAVAPDPQRPLEVMARGVTTRVTGTEFVISLHDEDLVDVAVLEGSVRVQAQVGEPAALNAGEAIRGTEQALEAPAARPAEEMATWRTGLLVVRNRTLVETLKMLDPYTSYNVDVSRLSSPGPQISATFLVERADDALVDLIQSHRLQFRQSSPNLLVLRDPAPIRPN